MKVLLLAVPIMDFMDDGTLAPISMDASKPFPPYGLYLLAAVLNKVGYDVKILDFIAMGSIDLTLLKNELVLADLVGIGATSLNWPVAILCIKNIHTVRNDLPIVIGGIHATMFDSYILQHFPVSYVIRGEGEIPLISLCEALEGKHTIDKVPSLTYKTDGQIMRNPASPSLTGKQLAELPVPMYNMLPDQVYDAISLESSRGCPFDCAFCSTSYRRSWRSMPVNNFVDKVESIIPFFVRVRKKSLQIVDDEWSVDTERCIKICEEFRRRGIKNQIVFDARATDLQNEKFIEAIKPYANHFLIGAESGYDEGLKQIGKGTSCQILETTAKLLAEHKIAERCTFSFVIGFPWETKREAMKTVEFACNLFTKYGVRILVQWYCMIPGSRLWDQACTQEKVNASHYNDFGFFKNLYLFRTGVQLLPSEILNISSKMLVIKSLAEISYPGQEMVQYRTPVPICKYFPEELLIADKQKYLSALSNLRELSALARKVSEKSVENLFEVNLDATRKACDCGAVRLFAVNEARKACTVAPKEIETQQDSKDIEQTVTTKNAEKKVAAKEDIEETVINVSIV